MSLKLVFISDTHTQHDKVHVPECDILFHCGDWTYLGEKETVENFAKWLNTLPARHIVITPGNHEIGLFRKLPQSRSWILDHCPRANLLIHESVEIQGINIFGSPYTPYFHNWAWNAGRTIAESVYYFKPFIGDLWQDIPENTQILITHGPPYNILDTAMDYNDGYATSVGCVELSKRIEALPDLKIHAFGHLHYDGGKTKTINNIKYVNAAVCNDAYKPSNSLITVDFKI